MKDKISPVEREQIIKINIIRSVSFLSGLTRANTISPVPAFAQSPAIKEAKGRTSER